MLMEILDWGKVTPEANLDGRDEYIYIYNHDLSTEDKIERTMRFIIGRLNYYDKHLPLNPKQFIQIDIRGQQISEEVCDSIIVGLQKIYQRPDFLEISFVKQ